MCVCLEERAKGTIFLFFENKIKIIKTNFSLYDEVVVVNTKLTAGNFVRVGFGVMERG